MGDTATAHYPYNNIKGPLFQTKNRNNHVLAVTCAYCKTLIAHYQKVGESNLVKMYNHRIIDGALDFSQHHGAIFYPNCNQRIATRYITRPDKKEAYRLVPSAFNKKKVCRATVAKRFPAGMHGEQAGRQPEQLPKGASDQPFVYQAFPRFWPCSGHG